MLKLPKQRSIEAHRSVSLLADAHNSRSCACRTEGQGLSQFQGFLEETGALGLGSVQHSMQNDIPSGAASASDDGGGCIER